MAEAEETADKPAKKGKPLLVGLVLALVCAGAGFGGTYVLLPTKSAETGSDHAENGKSAAKELAGIGFVALDPLIISLGPAADNRHLRFAAQLEVDAAHQAEVAKLSPRVLDALNTYLRAVDIADLQDPTALIRFRAQMLRRIQVIAGGTAVRDLLVTEFVLN